MEIILRKSLRHKFWCLNLSEEDLHRIAVSMRDKCTNGSFSVEVRSADGEDLFRSDDPAFFISSSMPKTVARVQMLVRSDPVTCDLDLRAGSDHVAELTTSGSDVTTVSGLFRELVRELEGKQAPGSWVARHIDSFFVYLALSLLASLAVYSLFDLPLTLANQYVPGFIDSTVYTVIGWVGWSCVLLTTMGGGFVVQDRLKTLYPAVQFCGRLSDPYSEKRRSMSVLFVVILLPIILNVFASFLTDLLKLWSKN